MSKAAYVMINCIMGKEKDVVEEIKRYNSIKEVHELFGAYDIIAKFDYEKEHEIKEVSESIKKINNVRSSLTLVCFK